VTQGPTSRCLPLPAAGASPFVGDPIDVVRGAVIDDETDFRLPDAAVFVAWGRSYDSTRSDVDRGIGRGFRHEFDHELRFDVDGLRYSDPNSREVAFPALDVDGSSALRKTLILERVSEERYRVEHPDRRCYEFLFVSPSEPARLLYIREHDKAIELQYEPHRAQLQQVLLGALGTLRFEWSQGRIARVSLAKDNSAARSDLARYSYDAHGRLAEVENAYEHKLQYAYDTAHRVVQKTDRRGFAFHFEYDAQGRCVASRGQDGAEAVQLEYRPLERTTIVTRHDGGRWEYMYDATGTVVRIVDPYQGVRAFFTNERGDVDVELDPHGNPTRVLYDHRNYPAAKVDPWGEFRALPEDPERPSGPNHWQGRSALQWEHGTIFQAPARLPSHGDAIPGVPAHVRESIQTADPKWGGQTRWVHNVQGLPLREEREDGSSKRWTFDANANVRTRIDFDGRKRNYEYASDGLRVREIDAIGSVKFEWSASRQLTALVDAGGTRSEFVLDAKDRVREVRRHGKLRESYEYDLADNLVAKRDGRGELLFELSIGPGNRPLSRTLASGETQRLEYDERGRLVNAEGEAGTCKFAYTPGGLRILDERDGRGVKHEWSSLDALRTTVLDRFKTRYRWADRDTWVIHDPTGRSHVVRKLADGIFRRELANGWCEICQYDVRGRTLSKSLYRVDDREWRWDRVFKFSGEGDLLERRDSSAGTTRYTYDEAHRLKEVARPEIPAETYRYDAAGNLLAMPGLREGWVSPLQPAADGPGVALTTGNRLHRANGELFHYDHRDHVVARDRSGGATTYTRDSLDRLVRIEAPDLEWTASYDVLGRRTRKTVNGQTWTYFWDTDRLAAEILPDERVRVYVYADQRAVVPLLSIAYDSVDAEPDSGRCSFYVSDHLGCVERVLDIEGHTVWRARLEPYGVAHLETGEELYQPFRQPGHYYDAETGLHYNRFRYYDPALGRYLESDPIGVSGGLNLYAYTRNPLKEVDLRGLNGQNCSCSVDGPDSLHPVECPDGREATRPPHDKDDLRPGMALTWQQAKDKAIAAAHAQLKSWKDSMSKGALGPVVAVIVDQRTGQQFPGHNSKNKKPPANLHPTLQPMVDAAKNKPKHRSKAGSHAEVHALNDALHARKAAGQPDGPEALQDMHLYNVWTKGNSTEEGHMTEGGKAPRCGNCRNATDGVVNHAGDAPTESHPSEE
jgi:RHS repeat-associated protein